MKYNVDNIDISNGFVFFWGNKGNGKTIGCECLSQWYISNFVVDGITYCCMEQYMMSEKAKLFNDKEMYNKIMNETDQKTIKYYGRLVNGFNSKIWDKHKCDIIIKGNFHKFSQNEELKNYLLSTKDSILVEASPFDTVWGIGMSRHIDDAKDPKKWKGRNLLGFCLMEVRDMLV